jgi:hypothetical protein
MTSAQKRCDADQDRVAQDLHRPAGEDTAMIMLARLAVAFALIVAPSVRPATAEPILAVYHVQVSERMTWESNPIWEPFFQEFTLLMRFDPALGGDRTYGPVSFSEVPLPGVPAPGEVATSSSTAHGQFDENPFGAANLFAVADENQIGMEGGSYFRTTRLISNLPVDFTPVFSPETFPAHLVLGTPNFDYGTSLFRTGLTPVTLNYRGVATLLAVNPEPIPEPATMLLVGGGLVALARRRLRG